MAHGGEAPYCNRERVADPRAEPIDDRASRHQPDGVGGLKRGDDVAVVDLAPMQVALQLRREDSQHLTIDVVEGPFPPRVAARRSASDSVPASSLAGLAYHQHGSS